MSKYIVYSSFETSVFIFLFPGIRQFVISPNHDEDNEACQQSQEILRMTDGLSHMRKSTGAGQQEIYLHREEPALNLFPALTNHSSNHADSQALIQLKKEYCDKKKCLYCRIGYEYLKRK